MRSPRAFADRYEEARAYALDRQSSATLPQGVALLLRRGVPDWLQAWREQSGTAPEAPHVAAGGPPVGLSTGVRFDVALVLATMVLHAAGRERDVI